MREWAVGLGRERDGEAGREGILAARRAGRWEAGAPDRQRVAVALKTAACLPFPLHKGRWVGIQI